MLLFKKALHNVITWYWLNNIIYILLETKASVIFISAQRTVIVAVCRRQIKNTANVQVYPTRAQNLV